MAERTITSANSIVTLTVAGLFPTPQQLFGFSTDRAWATDPVDLAEAQMGVDGRLSFGYTPNPVRQTFSLQADSRARDIFVAIAAAMKSAREIYVINADISIPSTNESFICTRGVLVNYKVLPDAAKVLQPVDAIIVWESVNSTLI